MLTGEKDRNMIVDIFSSHFFHSMCFFSFFSFDFVCKYFVLRRSARNTIRRPVDPLALVYYRIEFSMGMKILREISYSFWVTRCLKKMISL
jgi:hypothetical protein